MFFNELYDLYCQSGTDETWENFIKAIALDKRMGSSHMQDVLMEDLALEEHVFLRTLKHSLNTLSLKIVLCRF